MYKHKKRGCEEMRIHFFTAPFFVSFSLLVVKNKRKRAYFPLSPKNQLFKIKLPYPYVPVASYGICTG